MWIGPYAGLSKARSPRSCTPYGKLKGNSRREAGLTRVRRVASIGAGTSLLPAVTVVTFDMVGAGAVVTHDVPAHGLVVGNPARLVGFVCACGSRLDRVGSEEDRYICPACRRGYRLESTPGVNS